MAQITSMFMAVRSIEDVITKETPTVLGIVANNVAMGVSKDNYIPKQSEQLANSALKFSNFDRGIVRWITPYALRKYFSNISGVPEWDKEWWKVFGDKETQFYATEIEQRIQNKI